MSGATPVAPTNRRDQAGPSLRGVDGARPSLVGQLPTSGSRAGASADRFFRSVGAQQAVTAFAGGGGDVPERAHCSRCPVILPGPEDPDQVTHRNGTARRGRRRDPRPQRVVAPRSPPRNARSSRSRLRPGRAAQGAGEDRPRDGADPGGPGAGAGISAGCGKPMSGRVSDPPPRRPDRMRERGRGNAIGQVPRKFRADRGRPRSSIRFGVGRYPPSASGT